MSTRMAQKNIEGGVPIKNSILIYCNNVSNIYLFCNQVFRAQTKHIEVHYHFIRDRVLTKDTDLQNINTN